MTLRKGVAVAAVAALGFGIVSGIDGGSLGGEALASGGRHGDAPPVADAGRDAVAAVGDIVVLDGSGSTDPEGEELRYDWRLVERPATSLAALSDAAAPKPHFTVDADGRYLFELVVVSDEDAISAPDMVEVNTGDVAPVADAGPDARVAAGATATLDGAGSTDAGGDLLTHSWRLVAQPAGSAAALSDAAAVRPTLAIDVPGEYVAELEVGDGVARAADRVTLTTEAVAPAARAGADQPAAPYVPLVLDAELTGDADGDILSFEWNLLSAPDDAEAEIARRHARRAAFAFSAAGTYVLQLTVRDAGGDFARDTVVVSTGNTRPVADAGPDVAIAPGAPLRLDASRSTDLDGDRLTFRWAVVAAPEGSTAALDGAAGVRPWFTPDIDGSYVLQLSAFDGTEWSAPDTVLLTTGNLAPVADTGPDRWQPKRGVVTLDGLASHDADGDALTYRWALLDGPRGSRAAIADPTAPVTEFTADRRGTYLAQLVVDDGTAASAPSLVVIGVGKGAWGDEKDSEYDDFDLRDDDDDDDEDDHDRDGDDYDDDDDEDDHDRDGDDYDDDEDDDHAAMQGARIVAASYRLPQASSGGKGHEDHGKGAGKGHEEHGKGHGYGHYEDDDHDDDDDDDDDDRKGGKQAGFSGHPGDVNIRPVAEPGAAQQLARGAVVQLDGSASSDANGDALSWRWDLIVAPAGSTAAFDDAASPTPTFTADVSGFYVAQLVVFDGLMQSFPRTVAVLANTAPVADAGPDQEVVLGTEATLDGTGSYDPDGDALSYQWTVTARPAGGTTVIDDATSPVARFTPNVFGTYEIRLVVSDGIAESAPDSATITIVNTPPVAEAGDDVSATIGDTVTLDGTGSFDPDGQTLSYRWRFTARPSGSSASFIDATVSTPSFTADVEGLYVAELIVNDGVVDSAPDVVGVRAGPLTPNRAPVLAAIGPQTVFLGETLTLQLSALDPDGDAVYFFANPLPLPANMTLDALTGTLSFRPDANQIGSLSLVLGVSDGMLRDSESVTFTVKTPPPGTPTGIVGRVLDANAHEAGETVPLAGATVRLVESGQTAITDADGNFFLAGTPSGDLRLDISLAGFEAVRHDLALAPNTLNAVGPFYLAQINTGTGRFYGFWAAARDGLTISEPTTGVSVWMAPGIQRHLGFRYAGTFYVSPAPYDAVAQLVPAWISPCQVMAIEASPSFVQNFRAIVTMPNRDNLAAGSQVDIWNLNPASNRFQVVSIGTVAPDGLTLSGQIVWPTLFFAAPPAPLVTASADMNPDSLTPTLLADGNVSQAIALPEVLSLGQDRAQALVYNSRAADPRPIIAMDTTILGRTGVPARIEGRLEVGGVAVAGPLVTDTQRPAPLPEDADATIRHAAQFDAGELRTGVHDYRFTATANYGCSTVSATATGEIPVINQSDSSFGAGWTLAGLERLHIADDGDVLLTRGDGSAGVFDANPRPNFFPPVGIPAAAPGAGVLDDFNGDGHLDMAVPEMGNGNVAVLLGDGTGGFPADTRFAAGTPPVGEFPDTTTTATGDFDNDGLRDLLVSTQMSGRVRLYLGNGDGTFQAPRDTLLRRPQGLAVGDFDGDGNDDFVVGTLQGTTLVTFKTYVYFGDGAGGFPAGRVRDFVVPWPTTPVVADFDNNGTADIAIASAPQLTAGSKIVVALSDGAGGFVISETPADFIRNFIGRFPLAAADFNGDGNQDLALTVREAGYITLYFGNGIGGFFRQMRVPNGIGETNSLTATDYDEDGDIDIVASGQAAAAIVLFESDGKGGLAVAETVPVGRVPLYSVRAGDFNGDGGPDLQTGDPDNIYVLLADRRQERRFRSPGADFSQLDRTADGGYVRRMTDGTVMEYDETGLMTAMVDRNGNRTEYAYGAGGLLASISDPADPTRSTTFDYDGGSLSAITDLAGRTSFFQIDSNGELISFADAEANVFRYAYDGDSRLSAFASARGFVTSFDYGFAGQYLGTNNPDGTSVTAEVTGSLGLVDPGLASGEWIAPEDRIAKMQDAKGNIYEFEVNEYGHAIRITDPADRTTIIERDADNLVRRTITDNDGRLPDGSKPATVTTALDYDDAGNVISKTEGAGTALARVTRFEYEPNFNRTTRVIDPAAGETVMEYDPATGDLLSVTDAEGGVQSFTYDGRGLRLTATDQNGNTTRFEYDEFFGNLESSTNGAGDVTKMLRDDAGNVTGVTEGFGSAAARTTSYEFDALGRITLTTDAEGGVTETLYDADGNTIAEIDATGIVATGEYDEMGRLASESHPATGTVTRTYDENGNMASIIYPTGNIAHFEYDSVNRAIRTVDPAGGERLFAYDKQDNPAQVLDANGNATDFKYDVHGRGIERSNELGNTWTFAYDSRDNMVETVDAKGQTIEKSFDALNRMTGVVLYRADGTMADRQVFAYDDLGQKTLAYDNDSELAWTYDGANRVATAATHAGLTNVQKATLLMHAYDAAGDRTSLSDSEGGITGFGHDGEGRLVRVTTAAGDTIGLTYDPAGRLVRIANPNAAATDVLYDALTGRPGSIAHTSGAVELARFDYGFDTDGKITSIADAGGTRSFTYDETLQLTGGGYPTATEPRAERYAYDPEGNRTSSHLSASYTHDTANRLRADADSCYDYDANGNLTRKRDRVGIDCTDTSGAATEYSWDVLNRLVRIDNPDGSYAAYRYDAQGRRIEKDVNGALTRYVYDGDAILLEYDGADVLQARYTHGEEIDQPLAMARDTDADGQLRAAEQFFYHTDHLGSVRLLTDASGAVANRYDYDAFGNWEDTSYETVANPFGFTARERDAESGLMFYRARYYDPKLGRFISQDPIGFAAGDLNLYRYVFNNVLQLIDPSGQVSGLKGDPRSALVGAVGAMGVYSLNFVAAWLGYALAYRSLTFDPGGEPVVMPPFPWVEFGWGLASAAVVGAALGLAAPAWINRLFGRYAFESLGYSLPAFFYIGTGHGVYAAYSVF